MESVVAPRDLCFRPEYANLKSAVTRQQPSRDGDAVNLIQKVYDEDLDNIDKEQSARIPPIVKRMMDQHLYKEAGRKCYELEKTMARCVQDKLWTTWKCQKERDVYYKCLHIAEEDPALSRMFRWKYTVGVFNGEIHARNHIMNSLWKEYFPDKDMPHLWAEE